MISMIFGLADLWTLGLIVFLFFGALFIPIAYGIDQSFWAFLRAKETYS